MLKWTGSSFPVLSFLDVPGRTVQPLWLMMGTAFRVYLPSTGSVVEASSTVATEEQALKQPARPLFLTAKHTFTPWDFTKNSSDIKIPEDYRKARYTVGRIYTYAEDSGDAAAAPFEELSLVSLHPTCDVALLSLRYWPPVSSTANRFVSASALPLLPAGRVLREGTAATVEGFRGTGRLGELDTFDPSLLQTLTPAEREVLLKELKSVEGRQTRVVTDVAIVDPIGKCCGVGEAHRACYHGMSGGPVVVRVASETASWEEEPRLFCAGILYGRHADHPESIGYTPTVAFATWLLEAAERFERASAVSTTRAEDSMG